MIIREGSVRQENCNWCENTSSLGFARDDRGDREVERAAADGGNWTERWVDVATAAFHPVANQLCGGSDGFPSFSCTIRAFVGSISYDENLKFQISAIE